MHRRVVVLAGLMLPAIALAAPNGQTPFAGSNIPQFTQALPLLSVQPGGTINTIVSTNTSSSSPLDLRICEFKAHVLPPNTFVKGKTPETWVWGYLPVASCPLPTDAPLETYLGPVLVNQRGTPTTIRFTNALPLINATNVLAYKYSTDQTLHWADPLHAELNQCHMDSGNPPLVNQGIPGYTLPCSLNFGENWDPVLKKGVFSAAGIPAVPHLHGGEVPPAIDGGPDAWFTSDGLLQGHDYYTNPNVQLTEPTHGQVAYSYPNTQGAAPIWFHDHTLGATRLNVYAGTAGGYYVLDPAQESYFSQIKMRPVTEVIPIILQDRMFDTNGQLYFPTDFPGGINGPSTNPQHPYWIPEFVGDTIVINGKAWPYLNVEPRRYRFLFLNGSNARAYEMFLVNPLTKVMNPGFWVIGNDGGFLDFPAYVDPNAVKPAQNHLIMQPGERYEVIIDFSKFAGQTLVLKNVAKAPYPAGKAPQGTTTGQLMQFRVSATAVSDLTYNPATSTASLRPAPIVRLSTGTPAKVRQLTLNEAALAPQIAIDPVTGVANTAYPGGPVEILVNNSLFSGDSTRPYKDFAAVTLNGVTSFVSETPKEGDIELWEIVNTTMDAHPMHTHLATFQILNRQNYNAKAFMAAYAAGFTLSLPAGCTAGLYCPGYGPPYNYDPAKNALSGGKWGGNPDVTPYLANAIQLPDPNESGWKDTFIAYPGMVNRFLIRWGPQETAVNVTTGYPFSPNDGTNGAIGDSHGYVWHCHIIDHEDNEMMRPYIPVNLSQDTQ